MCTRWSAWVGSFATLITLATGAARAVEFGEQFQLHSYGQAIRAISNVGANGPLPSDRETNYYLSLVGIWQVTDRTKAWSQVSKNSETGRTRLDWAFVDYQTSSGPSLHFGRIPLPFGLLNEIRDVQALQFTASLPYMYDDDLALIDESFDGASAQQNFHVGATTGTAVVYGAMRVDSSGTEKAHGPILGGRVILETPVDGLSFRGSVYEARLARHEDSARQSKRGVALSVRYMGEQIDLQAELARGFRFDHSISTGYVQVAIPFAQRWRAVTRVERINTDTRRSSDDSFREQRLVLGVTYAVSKYVGLRLEQQFHRGYGIPVAHGDVEAGAGRNRWTSTLFGVNFAF